MKKFISVICAAAMGAFMANAGINIIFDGSDFNTSWVGSNGIATVADGHLNVEMGLNNGKYRADIKSDKADFDIDPEADKFFAVKFIGAQTQANYNLLLRDSAKNNIATNKTSNKFNGSFTTAGGNTVSYFELNMTATAPTKATFIEFKIADNTTEPHAYTLDWIKTFASMEEMEAYINTNDDGADDKDEPAAVLPAVFNETTGTGYNALTDAIDAATAGDVIVINRDQELPNSRLGFGKSLTFKGGEDGVKIIRRREQKNMLINSKANITFENLTFDNGNVKTSNERFMEVSGAGTEVTFNNVTFSNFTLTTQLVEVKGDGIVHINGVKGVNNACTEGEFFLGKNKVSSISGDNNIGLYFEAEMSINATDLTNTTPIPLYVAPGRFASKALVNGCEDLSKFELMTTGYVLAVKDGNITAEAAVLTSADGKSFSTLEDAVASVAENGTAEFTLLMDLRLPNVRVTIDGGKTITVKGEGTSIQRWFDSAAGLLVKGATVAFEGIGFDVDNREGRNHFIEANGANTSLTLKDIRITNAPATTRTNAYIKFEQAAGVVENVKFIREDAQTDETEAPATTFDVNIKSDKVTLRGDNAMSIYLDGCAVAAEELTNEAPVMLTRTGIPAEGESTEPVMAVTGWTNPDNFVYSDSNYMLKATEGGLCIEERVQTGVEGVAAEATTIDVYNMQGVRVRTAVAADKALRGLEPGLYIAGGRKVCVR